MEDYTRYQLDELYNILSQVQQAIELLEEEEKKKNKWRPDDANNYGLFSSCC